MSEGSIQVIQPLNVWQRFHEKKKKKKGSAALKSSIQYRQLSPGRHLRIFRFATWQENMDKLNSSLKTFKTTCRYLKTNDNKRNFQEAWSNSSWNRPENKNLSQNAQGRSSNACPICGRFHLDKSCFFRGKGLL